jgi:hypothetical protein
MALTLASCADSDDTTSTDETETTDDATSGEGTDDAADDATASDESADDAASDDGDSGGEVAGGGADCLIGTWEAPRDEVEAVVLANVPAVPGLTVELVDGTMTAEFRADQTAEFVTQASVSAETNELGTIDGSMDGLNVVDWAVDGDTLTYTTTSFELTLAVGDLPLPEVPGPAPGESASATFSCEGDTLELTPDNPLVRLPQRLTRVA